MISLLTVLLGCTTSTSTSLPVCDVELTIAEPTTGVAGDSVVLTGGPLTDTWDTAVYFGTARALITDIDRDSCGDCDACRETNNCTACGDCDVCDVLCDTDCIETATVEVPALESGAVEVLLFNGYGVSTAVTFTVDAPGDTGDTSTADTGDSGNGKDTAADTAADTGAADTADSGK
ncbi:MAG: hypothetical protein ACI8RZ_007532 [Myxococcota bacterium]|jgi:hypothetical protein